MKKIYSILLVLFPLLSQIRIPGQIPVLSEYFSLGELIMLPLTVLVFLLLIGEGGLTGVKLYRFSGFFLLTAVLILTTVYSTAASDASTFLNAARPVIELVTFFMLLYSARDGFDFYVGAHALVTFATLSALYYLVQKCLVAWTTVRLPNAIFREWLAFAGEGETAFLGSNVPTSVFLTPERMAYYLLPALAVCLLWNRNAFRGMFYVCSLILTGALVVTGLPFAVFGTVLLWCLMILSMIILFWRAPYNTVYRITHQYIGTLITQVVFFLLTVGVVTFLLADGILGPVLQRAFADTLSTERMFSGLQYFETLPNRFRIFGVGLGNIGAYASGTGMNAAVAEGAVSHMTLFTGVCLSAGVFGFFALLYAIFALLNNQRGKCGFSVALVMICLVFLTDMPIEGGLYLFVLLALEMSLCERHFYREVCTYD